MLYGDWSCPVRSLGCSTETGVPSGRHPHMSTTHHNHTLTLMGQVIWCGRRQGVPRFGPCADWWRAALGHFLCQVPATGRWRRERMHRLYRLPTGGCYTGYEINEPSIGSPSSKYWNTFKKFDDSNCHMTLCRLDAISSWHGVLVWRQALGAANQTVYRALCWCAKHLHLRFMDLGEFSFASHFVGSHAVI